MGWELRGGVADMSTHRMSKTPEFVAWADMKQRCFNENHKRYKDYGGKGIGICQKWINSFEEFYKDMGDKPEPKSEYSLDRINNQGDYEPQNCKWRTWEEQYNNRNTCIYITYNNKTQTITQWAKEIGLHPTSLMKRLKTGKSIEESLTLPRDESAVRWKK